MMKAILYIMQKAILQKSVLFWKFQQWVTGKYRYKNLFWYYITPLAKEKKAWNNDKVKRQTQE